MDRATALTGPSNTKRWRPLSEHVTSGADDQRCRSSRRLVSRRLGLGECAALPGVVSRSRSSGACRCGIGMTGRRVPDSLQLVAASGHRSGTARGSGGSAAARSGGGGTAARSGRSTAARGTATLALLHLAHPVTQRETLLVLATAAVARIAASSRSRGTAAGSGRGGTGRGTSSRGTSRRSGTGRGSGRSTAARSSSRGSAGRFRSTAARGRSTAVVLLVEQASVSAVQAGETHQRGGNPCELHFQFLLSFPCGTEREVTANSPGRTPYPADSASLSGRAFASLTLVFGSDRLRASGNVGRIRRMRRPHPTIPVVTRTPSSSHRFMRFTTRSTRSKRNIPQRYCDRIIRQQICQPAHPTRESASPESVAESCGAVAVSVSPYEDCSKPPQIPCDTPLLSGDRHCGMHQH